MNRPESHYFNGPNSQSMATEFITRRSFKAGLISRLTDHFLVGAASLALLSASPVGAASTVNWPQFRGPNASGVSEDAAPVQWNVKTGENIQWQTEIPGLGHASPVVWQDRIYVATAVRPGAKQDLRIGLYGEIDSVPEKEPHQWRMLCLDKATGKVLWNKLELEVVPRIERHTKASHCNSTPATDGQRIVALFGSEGLYCFDLAGKELWHKDLGKMDAGFYMVKNNQWGFASSPVLVDGKVIVQCDVNSGQFLAAFDAVDGHELWRTARKDVPTWCTPLVATSAGRTQIVAGGLKESAGYDLATGKRLWWLREGGDIPVSSPVLAPGLVILTSAHGGKRPIRAIRLGAQGDITPEDVSRTNRAIAWTQPKNGVYLSTPIVVGGLVWGNQDGILTCSDVQTGQIHYNERISIGQGFTASAVAAGGNLYLTGEEGDVFVLPATPELRITATNKLGGICLSTPAISEGTIFFRTTEKIIAVGTRK